MTTLGSDMMPGAASATVASHAGRHGTESARVRLGSSISTPTHILGQLTRDPAVTVRAAVAMNPACPPHVDQATSRDPDEHVRSLLAHKLAMLAPSLSRSEQADACQQVRATLAALAADAAVSVRAVIADCVKAMPDAPRDMILQLAQDTALTVCGPIIRLSPLLTDADLLALLATPPHPEISIAVASRLGLTATVADAIVDQADGAPIRALLSNHSAAIQEATLDALIAQAEMHPDWHGPLVHRPVLTVQAVLALSGFVAIQLVDTLAQRANLDPATASTLQRCVAARFHQDAELPARATTDDEIVASVRRLDGAGSLDEAALIEAARAGDERRVAAVLAVASGFTLAAVDRAASLRSAKGLISLVWKAGFTMRAAAIVQTMLAKLGPGATILAGPREAFPFTTDEMQWQLEILGQPGR